MRKLALAVFALVLAACEQKAPNPVFHAADNPKLLSEWGMLAADGQDLVLGVNTVQYDLTSALFSDYALKLRTVYLPEGLSVELAEDQDALNFPVGAIISKTFYYPKGLAAGEVLKPSTEPVLDNGTLDISELNLIETRLLVHRENGWAALPYVWNTDQTEAKLMRTGDLQKLTLVDGDTKTDFAYLVPNVNQCAGCHATNATTKEIVPIGPKLRHLKSAEDFLSVAAIKDYFKNADWQDQSQTLEARARAYLDINCSHCHNKVGPADTSGLHLEPASPTGPNLGICKTPIAAGTGTGNRKFGIVPGKPEESIFSYRVGSTNPAVMMPELGRSLAHNEGLALIEDWISEMDGSCAPG